MLVNGANLLINYLHFSFVSSAIYPIPVDGAQQQDVFADRCKVRVPYAGNFVSFEIILEGTDVFDVIIDQQFMDFAPSFTEVPSLFSADSNANLPQRLVCTVHELLIVFKRYSLQKLKVLGDSGSQTAAKIMDQISEIAAALQDGYESKYLEVVLCRSGATANGNSEWGVSVQLKLEFLKQTVKTLLLTRGSQTQSSSSSWKHEAESSAKRSNLSQTKSSSYESSNGELDELLPALRFDYRISMQNDTITRRQVTLCGEKRLETLLGGNPLAKSVEAFHPTQTVLDFVQHFVATIASRADLSLSSVSRRREFLAALFERFGSSVIEFDAEMFRVATFLVATDTESPQVLLTGK